jgi:hypothetical protein
MNEKGPTGVGIHTRFITAALVSPRGKWDVMTPIHWFS